LFFVRKVKRKKKKKGIRTVLVHRGRRDPVLP
jgi:hypothetical protein